MKKEYTHNGSFMKSFGLLLLSIVMSAMYILIWLGIIFLAK